MIRPFQAELKHLHISALCRAAFSLTRVGITLNLQCVPRWHLQTLSWRLSQLLLRYMGCAHCRMLRWQSAGCGRSCPGRCCPAAAPWCCRTSRRPRPIWRHSTPSTTVSIHCHVLFCHQASVVHVMRPASKSGTESVLCCLQMSVRKPRSCSCMGACTVWSAPPTCVSS